MRLFFLSGACLLLVSTYVVAADWNLVFEDNFERAEVGPDWMAFKGALSIRDGRLELEGGAATALVTRPFAPDARLEFVCTANPDAPPCDLSCTVAGSPQTGYGYLFAFGGNNNRLNQLRGAGISIIDESPPFVIQNGIRYHMVATREGRRLTYEVNGVAILDGTASYVIGGPGFDRVGLVTWNGMLVDWFRVYERSEPHPDTPVYLTSLPPLPLERDGRVVRVPISDYPAELSLALDALNHGRLDEAKDRFEALNDVTLRMSGLLQVLCDPLYEEKPGELWEFSRRWKHEAENHPENTLLNGYLEAIDVFGRLAHDRGRLREAAILMEIGPGDNPFYWKAKMYRGRVQYMHSMEGGTAAMRSAALGWLRDLIEVWPEVTILREYVGEPVPWGEDLVADTSRHPAWAAYLREAYARQVATIETWGKYRQAEDGSLGGGWGDDVEILRSWVPVVAISTGGEPAVAVIEKLARGVWEHATEGGYETGIGDVEHSAEPSADAFPTMMLLRYGDPLYVELNLRSAKTIHDNFLGTDDLGFVRLKSNEVGAGGVNTGWRAGGDTPYTARMMKHFIWLAEFGNREALVVFLGWADGWRHWTMAELPDKPAGVAPETIWYPTGTIDPPNGKPWYDKGSNYYGSWDLTPGMAHDAFLTAYHVCGDPRFLEPYEAAAKLPQMGAREQWGNEPGGEAWMFARIYNQLLPERASMYHMLATDWGYDDTITTDPTAAVRRIEDNLARLATDLQGPLAGLRSNLRLQTTEVLATDRSAIPGALLTWQAYTGAVLSTRDAFCPSWAVTYETPGTDFAAYATYVTPRQLRVVLYSFRDEPTDIVLRVWRLEPGRYSLRQGDLVSPEGDSPGSFEWQPVRSVGITHHPERVPITLSPRTEQVVDIRFEEALDVPDRAPDLAIAPRDVRLNGETVKVTVHNIGNAPAEGFQVLLQASESGKWVDLATAAVDSLSSPRDFVPFTRTVSFSVPPSPGGRDLRAVLDPGDLLYELNETNNLVSISRP